MIIIIITKDLELATRLKKNLDFHARPFDFIATHYTIETLKQRIRTERIRTYSSKSRPSELTITLSPIFKQSVET